MTDSKLNRRAFLKAATASASILALGAAEAQDTGSQGLAEPLIPQAEDLSQAAPAFYGDQFSSEAGHCSNWLVDSVRPHPDELNGLSFADALEAGH